MSNHGCRSMKLVADLTFLGRHSILRDFYAMPSRPGSAVTLAFVGPAITC
jgi:hypothetical protein